MSNHARAGLSFARGLSVFLAGLMVIGTPIWFLSAALLTKGGFIPWTLGLSVMTQQLGPLILWAALVLGGVALVLLLLSTLMMKRGFAGWTMAVLAVVIGGAGQGYLIYQAKSAPAYALTDVTTDPVNPPYFTESMAFRRGAEALSLDYLDKTGPDGRGYAALQADYYPALGPLIIEASPELTFRTALQVARNQGWAIPTASESALMFEATDESLWFGFEEDIAVRVRAVEPGQTRVDVRSVARRVETNSQSHVSRIQQFLTALSAQLN